MEGKSWNRVFVIVIDSLGIGERQMPENTGIREPTPWDTSQRVWSI